MGDAVKLGKLLDKKGKMEEDELKPKILENTKSKKRNNINRLNNNNNRVINLAGRLIYIV